MAATSKTTRSKMKKTTGKKRKKQPIGPPPMKSRRQARRVTTQFHQLTSELDHVKQDKTLDADEKKEKIREIEAELHQMGGRDAYQQASILSTSFHKTSKWVFQMLTKLNLRPTKGQNPLKVLEVGAINTQLLSCKWLDVFAIDLLSQHEKIHQCDFFSLKPKQEYQVLVSSMVINCVPHAAARGQMLRMYRDHLQADGHLFLMLPLLCLTKSIHLTYDKFTKLVESVGFQIIATKNSPKVAFFCLKRIETVTAPASTNETTLRASKSGEKRQDFNVSL